MSATGSDVSPHTRFPTIVRVLVVTLAAVALPAADAFAARHVVRASRRTWVGPRTIHTTTRVVARHTLTRTTRVLVRGGRHVLYYRAVTVRGVVRYRVVPPPV